MSSWEKKKYTAKLLPRFLATFCLSLFCEQGQMSERINPHVKMILTWNHLIKVLLTKLWESTASSRYETLDAMSSTGMLFCERRFAWLINLFFCSLLNRGN